MSSPEDIAVIGIAMPTDSVEKGIKSLETLAGTGPKVEKAMDGIEKAVAKTGKTLGTLGQGNGAGLEQVGATASAAADKIQKVTAAATEADNSVKKVGSSAGAATAGMDKMGVSAKQTAAALRGVPAQFTDIVTALQGGQAPMTVLLQQGGQLKDMFGGAVPAAKAIGGYIVGMINPLTVGAAAAGVLGYALYSASQDAKTLKDAVVLTNSAVGASAGQLQVMAGHIGLNVSALNEFARSGSVGADAIESVTKSAIRFERLGGSAISDTVKAFEQLKKSPVEASIALNEKTNYLTASIYVQIKALSEQGRNLEAVKLAQDAYSKAQERMADGLEANLGPVDRMWKSIRESVEGAWKATKGFVGTDVPLPDRIGAQKKAIADAERQLADNRANRAYDPASSDADAIRIRKNIEDLKERLFILQSSASAVAGEAKERAKANDLEKAQMAWRDQLDATRPNLVSKPGQLSRKDTEALAAYNRGVAANATPAEIQSQVGLVLQKYDTGASIEAVKQAEDAKLQIIARAQDQVNALRATGQMTEIEQIKATTDLTLKSTDAKIAALQAERSITAGKQDTEAQVVQIDTQIAALRQQRKTEQVKGINEITVSLYKQMQAEMALQLLEAQAADRYGQGEIDRANQLTQETYDRKKALQDSSEELTLQLSLVGANSQAQQLAIEKLKIQVGLREQLKKINETDYGKNTAQKEADIERAITNATEAGNQAGQRITLDYWGSTVGSIQGDLTDSIIAGTKNGAQAGALTLRDAFVKEFENLILRPKINAFVNPLAQGIANAFGVSPNGSPGSGLINSAAGSAIGSSVGSVFGTGGYLAQFGSGFSGSASAASAMMGGAELTTAAQMGAAAATIAPYALAAIAIKSLTDYSVSADGNFLVANASSKGVGSVGTRADFTQSSSGIFSGGTTHNSTWGVAGADVTSFMDSLVKTATTSAKDYAKALGLIPDAVDGFTKQIEVSITGLNPEQQQAAISKAISGFVDEMVQSAFGGSLSAFAKVGETSAATLQRLGVDLTAANTAFDRIGATLFDVSTAGASAAASLVDAMGGLQQFSSTVQGYRQNFFTQDEQRSMAVKDITSALNSAGVQVTADQVGTATRAQVRALIDTLSSDKTAEGIARLAAVMNITSAFAAITPDVSTPAAASAYAAPASVTVDPNIQAAKDLRAQLDGLTLNSIDLHRKELEAKKELLNAENRLLLDQIDAAQKAKTIAGLQERIDIASGTRTQRQIALQHELDSATDASTQSLIRMVYTIEDAKTAFESTIAAASEGYSTSQAATDKAYSALERSVSAQRTVAQETANNAKAIVDSVTSAVKSLFGQVDAVTQAQAVKGMSFLDNALTSAGSTGYLPDPQALSDAISQVTGGLDKQVFSSQSDSDFQRLVLAGKLQKLGDIAKPQLTTAEQSLKDLDAMLLHAKDQVDALRGIDTGVKTVAQAIADLTAALLAEGTAKAKATNITGSGGAVYNVATQTGMTASGGLFNGPAYLQAAQSALDSGSATAMDAYNAIKSSGFTLSQAEKILGLSTGQLTGAVAQMGLPQFEVGTNLIPRDMVAQLHAGEAVVPRAYNPAAGGAHGNARLEALIEALIARVSALEAPMTSTAAATKDHADMFDRVTEGGNGMRSEVMKPIPVV